MRSRENTGISDRWVVACCVYCLFALSCASRGLNVVSSETTLVRRMKVMWLKIIYDIYQLILHLTFLLLLHTDVFLATP